MLNKQKSSGRARLKLLLLIPLAGGMICTSTVAFTKNYSVLDLYPEKQSAFKTADQDTSKKKKAVKLAPPPPPTKQATKSKKYLAPPPPPVEPNELPAARPTKRVVKSKKYLAPPPPPEEPKKKN